MKSREKPFPYDAVESSDAIVFIIDDQGADGRPARELAVSSKGLQIVRADGLILRMIHLHPRLIEAVRAKPTYIIEVSEDDARIYGAPTSPPPTGDLRAYFPADFYWFFGPETSSVEDLNRRPFTRLLGSVLPQAVAVAPGEHVTGPLIGLCLARPGMLALARGRNWIHVRGSLIVEAGLITGTTAGHPANDNIPESVRAAHADNAPALRSRDRVAWSSQLGIAFRPPR